jgi:prophage maintenance system killer protein
MDLNFLHPKVGKWLGIQICEQMLPELVYNMANYEGSPLTPSETDLITEGLSVGNGRKVEDIKQVYNIAQSWKHLIASVKDRSFKVNKETFIFLNALAAKDERLSEPGRFRTGTRFIRDTNHIPPLPLALDNLFQDMLTAYSEEENTVKQSYDLFLESSRCQFFGDGNKRTAQLMMNGNLLINGYSLISFSPENKEDFFTKMKSYYEDNHKEDMYIFLGKLQARIGLKKGGPNLPKPDKKLMQKIETALSMTMRRKSYSRDISR